MFFDGVFMKYLILFSVIFTLLSCSKFDSTKINCTEDKECPNNHICYKSQCYACGLDEYFNDEKGKCVNYCEENPTVCGEGQTCIGGRVNVKTTSKDYRNTFAYQCKCESGYVLMGKECKKDAKCKSDCTVGTDCGEDEVCIDNKCYQTCNLECSTESCELCDILSNEECEEVSGTKVCINKQPIIDCNNGEVCYNGACIVDNYCSSNNPNGLCPSRVIDEIFICKNGLCIEEREYGTKKYKDDCTETIECEEGLICGNKNPFSKNDSEKKCYPICDLRYGNCPDNAECFPYSLNPMGNTSYQNVGICYSGDCVDDSSCDPEKMEKCKYFTSKLSICIPRGFRKLGETCSEADYKECINDNQCRAENNEQCLLFKCIQNCTEDTDCLTPGQQCLNGKCIHTFNCDNEFICNEGICHKFCDSSIENDCNNNSECFSAMFSFNGQFNNNLGICFDECERNPKYFISKPQDNFCKGICFQKDATQKGFCEKSICDADDDCIKSKPDEEVACSLSFMGLNSCKVIGTKEVGDPCNNDGDCKINMVCSEDTKTCTQLCTPKSENFACPSNNSCFDISNVLGIPYKIEPSLSGICMPDSYLCSFDGEDSTLNIATTDSCTIVNSNSVCTRNDTSNNTGICQPDNCFSDEDCKEEAGSTCSLNVLGTKYCKPEGNKTIGESCKNDGDCKNNMFCDNKTCKELCKPNGNPCSAGTCIDISDFDGNPYKFESDIIGICN